MLFGCIADDFTGGSDIASFFSKGGLSTVLYSGIPKTNEYLKADVCVIALKTRTQQTDKAVDISLEALKWLKKQGAKQYYIKYCSTFDSTPEGNIGPICDAAMKELNVPYTIVCPALPINGRTVKEGCLYVNEVPLHKSPMKDHPLTPMWDYDLEILMNAQSKFSSYKLSNFSNEKEINKFIDMKEKSKVQSKFYLIPDHEIDKDAQKIVSFFGKLKLITGGSGLAYSLAKNIKKETKRKMYNKSASPALILAGSSSEATREQISKYKSYEGETYFLDPIKLLVGEETVQNIWDNISKNKTVLIYSSDSPENVKKVQRFGKEKVANELEKTFAELTEIAVNYGYNRIIIAGGETSGAVTKKMGYTSYHVGESIAPGVPVLIPTDNTQVRLVTKSGNFGNSDFFLDALSLT